MKVALVHDWLWGMRGGERCLEVICEIFPDADIYTLFYDDRRISPTIAEHDVNVSSLQMLPGVKNYYRYLFPIYSWGIADLQRKMRSKQYDVVISVSHCVAKNLLPPLKGVKHICYCLTPVRYVWDQYDVYFKGKLLEPAIRRLLPGLRQRDVLGARRVDRFIAISHFVAQRIREYYGRESEVIYPPVDMSWSQVPSRTSPREPYFLAVNALVPYKNSDLIVRAFNKLGKSLIFVGSGPEKNRLRALAADNISFLENVDDDDLHALYAGAEALVFAAEEDFGMVPVEIQAAGKPVICYGRGGVLETVRSVVGEGATGVFFGELTVQSICEAVQQFQNNLPCFSPELCRSQAAKFSTAVFKESFLRTVENTVFERELHENGEGLGRQTISQKMNYA